MDEKQEFTSTEFFITSEMYKNIFLVYKACYNENTITLCFNNKFKVDVPNILICAISKRIAEAINNDPTLKEFSFNVNFNEEINEEFFKKIKDVFLLEKITLNSDEEVENFARFGNAIGCDMLLTPIKERLQILAPSLTTENVLQIVEKKISLEINDFEDEIKIIGEKFETMIENIINFVQTEDNLKHHQFIASLLQSNSLYLTSEDNLLDFIINLSDINNCYNDLIQYVHLEFCSNEEVEKFLNYAKKWNTNNEFFIECIRKRLIQQQIDTLGFFQIRKHKKLVHVNSSNTFNGILRRAFTKQNLSINKQIFQYKSFEMCKNENLNIAMTDNSPFIITSYILDTDEQSNRQIRSWILEGKNGGNQWIDLDLRSFASYPYENTFEINEQTVTEIRLIQVGYSSSGTKKTDIKQFEIFGYMLE